MSDDTAQCMLCRIVQGNGGSSALSRAHGSSGSSPGTSRMRGGHCVFFQKRHGTSLHDVGDEEMAEILPTIKRVATALDLTAYGLRRAGAPPAGIDQTGVAQRIRERLTA